MPIPLAEFGHDPDAVEGADDHVAGTEVAQLAAGGAAVLDHDRRVHPLALDLDPLAAMPDPGVVVARGIEVVRGTAVSRRRLERGVQVRGGPASVAEQLFEQLLHRRGAWRRNAHLQPRKIVVGPADGEVDDLEAAAVLDHGVEDLGHQPRVDEVAFGVDDFGDRCIGAQGQVRRTGHGTAWTRHKQKGRPAMPVLPW